MAMADRLAAYVARHLDLGLLARRCPEKRRT